MSKSDETAEKTLALKPDVAALSDKIYEDLEVDEKDGVVTEESSTYLKNLPDGLTAEIDAKVDHYRTSFVAASTHAAGRLAVDALVKNKKLESVTASLALGSENAVRLEFPREKEYDFGNGPIVKHGNPVVKIDVKGGHNSGQLRIARAMIGDIASERLGKKK